MLRMFVTRGNYLIQKELAPVFSSHIKYHTHSHVSLITVALTISVEIHERTRYKFVNVKCNTLAYQFKLLNQILKLHD